MQDLHAVMNSLLQEWKGYLILDHSGTLNGEALRKLLGVSLENMGLRPMMATFRVEGPCDGRYSLTEQTAEYLIGQGHMAYRGAVWRWPAENREAREVTMTADSAVRILLDMRPTPGVTITARIAGPCAPEAARDFEGATKVVRALRDTARALDVATRVSVHQELAEAAFVTAREFARFYLSTLPGDDAASALVREALAEHEQPSEGDADA